jgi:hypothetical protein
MMQKRTRSILEELENFHIESDKKHIIRSRADSLIESAGRLLDLISETYTVEEADNLTRKLLNSIKSGDTRKFQRSLRKVNESRRDS